LGTRSIRRKRRAGRDPEGEVAARGVADAGDPGEVEWCVDGAQEVGRGRDVDERLRPPATRADSPVLDVPGRGAPVREVDAEIGHQRPVVPGPPVAAVHDDHDRVRAYALRPAEPADLAG